RRRPPGGRPVRVLLVGGGGREHALAWKIAQSPLLDHLISAPGNPGIARHAECVGVKDSAIDDLVALAGRERADLVVVGPELPLSLGLADRLREAGLPVFGPSRAAARLESSKAFSKDLMARYGIPTARFKTFQDAAAARRFCRELGAPLVVKTDGLAAGKDDILPVFDAVARGRGLPASLGWRAGSSVCVVLASHGYPGPPRLGDMIGGLDTAGELPGVNVFHAGTARRDGALVTSGGRVLGV